MTGIKSSVARIAGIFALILSASCSYDGVSPIRVYTVLVTPPVTSVLVGETIQLEAETTDALGNVLTSKVVAWSSSDEAIATVSESGLVTGHAPGSVVITATSEEKTGSATVEVEAAPFEPSIDVAVSGSLH